MKITITEAALKEMRKSSSAEHFIRIGLSQEGCCGMMFTVYEDVKRKDDRVVVVEDIEVLLSPAVAEALHNVKIDYSRRGLRKEYRVIPN